MKELLKSILDKLITGWGKRQLLKLGYTIIPLIGVSNEQIDSTVALIVAVALWGTESLLSGANRKRLIS